MFGPTDVLYMNRRQVLHRAGAIGVVSLAGCVGGDDQNPCPGISFSNDGPQKPYDSLQLHPMPEYVTEYSDSVVIQYRELGAAAQRAVQQAISSDEPYRQCTEGRDQTDVMALFSHIERRWQQADRSPHDHTYLQYEGDVFGITLVQEGDFIRVNSIPCTSEACPTTPTPPA